MISLEIGMQNGIPIWIEGKDRFKHFYILGQTRTGKSTLMLNMMARDFRYGFYSVVFIDPSGAGTKDALNLIPEPKRKDVLYISRENPISLNPLIQKLHPKHKARNVCEIIDQVITATTPNEKLTPRMKNILRSVVFKELEEGRTSLDRVYQVINWLMEHKFKGDIKKTVQGLIDRLETLLFDDETKEIICGKESPIIWKDVLERGKIVIVDTFGFPEENRIAIGSLVTTGIMNYYFTTRLQPGTYPPCMVYVDEFHNYVSRDYSTKLIPEGAKFNLSFVMAHQSIFTASKQLQEQIKAIADTIGTKIVFRAGASSATSMKLEFSDFTYRELTHLPDYFFLCKLKDEEHLLQSPFPPVILDRPFKLVKKPVKKASPEPIEEVKRPVETEGTEEKKPQPPKERPEQKPIEKTCELDWSWQ